MSKENYDLISNEIMHSSNRHKIAPLYKYTCEDKLELSNEEYWDLLIGAWSIGEHNSSGTHLEMWVQLLDNEYGPPPKKYLEGLPNKNKFKIYRGGEPWGFSWSLSKKKAKFFQERKLVFNPVHNPIPQMTLGPLSERTITRDQVLWYDNGREEREVVIIPDEVHEYLKSEQHEIDSKNCDDIFAAMEDFDAKNDNSQLSNLKANPEDLLGIPRASVEKIYSNSVVLEQLLELYDEVNSKDYKMPEKSPPNLEGVPEALRKYVI